MKNFSLHPLNHLRGCSYVVLFAGRNPFIGAPEEIIKELESSNDDKSIGQAIADRILDTILLAKSGPTECRNN